LKFEYQLGKVNIAPRGVDAFDVVGLFIIGYLEKFSGIFSMAKPLF